MEAATKTMHCLLFFFFFICSTFLLSLANADVHYYNFVVKATPVKRLCKTLTILTVNGQYPGPTITVRNGDNLVVRVVNEAKYNATIHWHGVRLLRNGWADGPAYVTQCPIQPGGIYTYRFNIEGQEGTLWWHGHVSWLRATVHGAIVILPKEHYPFDKPTREFPVILGEWWNRNPFNVIKQALKTGAAPNVSDAYTINGQPGDMYRCSSEGSLSQQGVCYYYLSINDCFDKKPDAETTTFPVVAGEKVLLRFINAAMEAELFVAIADHVMTVVGVDASYTKPFTTPILLISPGQTTDVVIQTNQPPGRYHISAQAYHSAPASVAFDNTTTTAILDYTHGPKSMTRPKPAYLPAFNDTAAAAAFIAGIKSPGPVKVPSPVDNHLFATVGVGLYNCPPHKLCGGPNGTRLGASISNYSLVLPSSTSLLQAALFGGPSADGVFTDDFPAYPPVEFDYTGNVSRSLWQPMKATKLYPIKFGSVVEVVFQGTNIFAADDHPMHLHGYEFYVLGTGPGNFDASRDTEKFNLVDPPQLNTVSVPAKGWAAIRFKADNPGVWFLHCHIDSHLTWGLATAFLVSNGVGELQSTVPPPLDLPRC